MEKEIAWWHLKAVKESQWDTPHDWIAAMDGNRLLRNRLGRWGIWVVSIYANDWLQHTALLGTSDEAVKTLWVSIREQSNMGDFLLNACYWPPDQDREIEAFILKSEEAPWVAAPGLVPAGIHWGKQSPWYVQRGHRQFRFLVLLGDNFFIHVTGKSSGLLTKKKYGMWRVAIRLWRLKFWEKWKRQIAQLQAGTSGEQNSTCSGIFLVECHGRLLWKVKGKLVRTSWSSRTTSLKHKTAHSSMQEA